MEQQEQVKEFLEALYGEHLKKHKGFIEILFLSDTEQGVFKQSFYPDIETLYNTYLSENWRDSKYKIIMGMALREEKGKATKKYINYITSLYLDIDYGPEGHGKKSEFKDKGEAEQHIKSIKPKPSIIVDSGYGFHIYWLLKKSEIVRDKKTEFSRIETILDGIIKEHKGDMGTGDYTRKLRLPGTKNRKNPDNIKDCKIIDANYPLRYDLGDFREYEDIGRQIFVNLKTIEIKKLTESDRITLDQLQKSKIAPTILEIIISGDQGGVYESRSHRDQAIITELLLNNFTNEQILSIFSNPDFSVSDKFYEKGNNGVKYIAFSINKARDYIEKNKLTEAKETERGIVRVPQDLYKNLLERYFTAKFLIFSEQDEYKKIDGEHYLIYRRMDTYGDREEIKEYQIKKDTIGSPDKRVPLKYMREAYISSIAFMQINRDNTNPYKVGFTLSDKLKLIGKESNDISGDERKERYLAEVLLANTQYRTFIKRGNKLIQEIQNLYAGIKIEKGSSGTKIIVTLNPSYLESITTDTGMIEGQYKQITLPLKTPKQKSGQYKKRALEYFNTLGFFPGGTPVIGIWVTTIFRNIRVMGYELARPGLCRGIWEDIRDTPKIAGHEIIGIEYHGDKEDVRYWKLKLKLKPKPKAKPQDSEKKLF